MAQAATLLAGPVAREARHRRRACRTATSPATPRALEPHGRRRTSRSRSLGFVLGRIAIVLVARIGEGFLRELRNRLFGHMMSLSLDYFETEKTGKIVARMTSDIDAMQELVSQGLVLFVQNIVRVHRRGHRRSSSCRGSSRSASS